jgi:phosphoserine phosphatase
MPETKAAIIFDFDGTLISGNMQDVLLRQRGVDPQKFWDAVEAYRTTLPGNYSRPLSYLNFLCDCANGEPRLLENYPFLEGLIGISNQDLRDAGKLLEYYPGVEDFLRNLKAMGVWICVASCGLEETIKGSSIQPYIDEIHACFLEERNGIIYRPSKIVDPLTKVGIAYKINLDFRNVIAVADGDSDMDMLMYVKNIGGCSILIRQTDAGEHDGIYILPPDYTCGSATRKAIFSRLNNS